MQIRWRVDRAFWLDVACRCTYATFFHTPFWQEWALATHPHYRDATIGAVLPNGTRAVLPLLQVQQRGLLGEYWSSHELYYGGVIADGPISAAQTQRLYRAACRWQTLRLRLTGNPLADTPLPTGFEHHDDFTHLLPLTPNFDQVFASFSQPRRTAYRSGIRQGVRVRRAEHEAEYRRYFEIYQDGLRRWHDHGVDVVGTPYTWNQFAACYQLSRQTPAVQLWLAEVGDQIIGGNVMLYWNHHAMYWHGAAHSDFLGYRPANVLHTEIIRDAITRGMQHYDFGPSGGVAGVIAHKDGYAPRVPLTRAVYEAPALGLARRTVMRHLKVVRRIRLSA